MRFDHGLKSLVYTSDTTYFDTLAHFCRGASILLSEATLQNIDKQFEEQGHMTAETAGKLARESGARKLVLTHIWPEYDKNLSLKEARTTFNGEIVIAKRGQIFSL
jgi:ribonuclease BN (tRNA processing enzyme)